MASVWDILNSINEKKPLEEGTSLEKEYNPFLINRGLSYHVDAIQHANEMNSRPSMPKDVQYNYLFLKVPKKRRFSKWPKKDSSEDVNSVRQYYGVSTAKAEELLRLLSPEQLSEIKHVLAK